MYTTGAPGRLFHFILFVVVTTFFGPPSGGWKEFLREVDSEWNRKRFHDDMLHGAAPSDLLVPPAAASMSGAMGSVASNVSPGPPQFDLSSGEQALDEEMDRIKDGYEDEEMDDDLDDDSDQERDPKTRRGHKGKGSGKTPEADLFAFMKGEFGRLHKTLRNELRTNREQITQEINTSVKQAVGPVRSEIQELKDRVGQQDVKIAALQRSSQSCDGQSARSASTAASARHQYQYNGPSAVSPAFLPTFISFQGWTSGDPKDVESRTNNIMNEARAQRVVLALMDQVSASRESQEVKVFDRARTSAELTNKPYGLFRIRVHILSTTPKETVWEIRDEWASAYAQKSQALAGEDLLGPVLDNPRISFQCEVPPWKTEQVHSGKKLVATFHKRKSGACTGWVKVQYDRNPSLAWAWAYPNPRPNADDKFCLGTWTSHDGWTLKASEVAKLDASIDAVAWQTALNSKSW